MPDSGFEPDGKRFPVGRDMGDEPVGARRPLDLGDWMDLPHRLTPPPDFYRGGAPVSRKDAQPPPPAPATTDEPPRAERAAGSGRARCRSLHVLTAFVALLLVAAGAVVVVLVCGKATDLARGPAGVRRSGSVSPPTAGSSLLSAPRLGIREAAFELSGDATAIRLRTVGLADNLYAISAPPGGATQASVTQVGTVVRVVLEDSGFQGASTVDIGLNASVHWSVRIESGLRRGDIDLARGRPGPLTLAGDAADLNLVLPIPQSVERVHISGGINRLRIGVPREAPVRIRARGGAGRVTVDGRTVIGVARDTSFKTDRWRTGSAGIDVEAVHGLGALRLEYVGR